MSKMSSLQNALSSAAKPTPPAAPAVRQIESANEQGRAPTSRPPSREGKIHIGAYLSPGFKSSLRRVQAETGEDTQTLIARALNELFRAHNVPVVDHK